MSHPLLTIDAMTVARAVDPLVDGCHVVTPESPPPAGYSTVVCQNGLTLALTASGQPPSQAALAAVAATDFGPVAAAARLRDIVDAASPGRKDLRDAAQAALDDIDAYLLIADTATQAQVRAAVKRLAQITRRVIIRLNNMN